MAEGARLESVCTLKGIEGSNPSLSANRTNFRNEVGFFISKVFLNLNSKRKLFFHFFSRNQEILMKSLAGPEKKIFFFPFLKK